MPEKNAEEVREGLRKSIIHKPDESFTLNIAEIIIKSRDEEWTEEKLNSVLLLKIAQFLEK